MIINAEAQQCKMLEAALAYAKLGLRVFPCHSVDIADGQCTCPDLHCTDIAKHPLTPNGVYDATTDADIIKQWWAEAPEANIGIAPADNMFVLEVEPDGLPTLAQLEQQYNKLPLTPVAVSGRKGKHFYFLLPPGHRLRNKVKLLPGIDIRTSGGYVIAPPSLHKNGNRYAWGLSPEVFAFAEAPAWLLALLEEKPKAEVLKPSAEALRLQVPSPTPDLSNSPGVGQGERNATLCKLIGVHLAKGQAEAEIEPLALAWAAKCIPPYPEADALRTLHALASKDGQKRGQEPMPGHCRSGQAHQQQQEAEPELPPLPEPMPRPQLDALAFQGFAGRIANAIAPETEADAVGVFCTFRDFLTVCADRV